MQSVCFSIFIFHHFESFCHLLLHDLSLLVLRRTCRTFFVFLPSFVPLVNAKVILTKESSIASQVGEDEFGRMLADVLKQNNVDNSGMRFDSHARTALAFVTLRADGEREFMFFRNPSADMLLTESELDKDLIKKVNLRCTWKQFLRKNRFICLLICSIL